MSKESLRRWVCQAEIDAGDADGKTTEELAEITRLKAENKRLDAAGIDSVSESALVFPI